MRGVIRLQAGPIDFERLVAMFHEREELDPLTAAYAYLSGRIDEFCSEHCIPVPDRDRAEQALRLARHAA